MKNYVVSYTRARTEHSSLFRDTSIEIEVYCNQGRPTVGDREVKTLPDDD